MNGRFQVFSVNPASTDDLARIFNEALVALEKNSSIPRLLPIANTINHLQALGVRCVLLQANVQDPDFLAEHAAYRRVLLLFPRPASAPCPRHR